MIKKPIPVEELRLGMYVVELDRPWLGTSFAFQGFPVTSDEQIAELRGCCKTVYVDPEREQWQPGIYGAATLRGSATYDSKLPVEAELPVAMQIYTSCQEALSELVEHLHVDSEIDAERLTTAVASLTASIERNPDAMLLLNSLRRKDNYGLARALDTSILMITFGRFLKVPPQRLEVLGLAGMLLDVSEPDLQPLADSCILGSCEDEDWKGHVMRSVEIIRTSSCLPDGLDEIVLLHHERQDGFGYPAGTKGDGISIEGALAALVDSFSSLTTMRSDGKQLSPSSALTQLHKLRGTHFHDGLVDQFIQCLGVYPVGTVVELTTGEIGMVIAQNPSRRLQPRVTIILDPEHRPVYPQIIVDLLREAKASRQEPYRIRRALPKEPAVLTHAEAFVASHG